MAFRYCPNCRTEYRPGFDVCADCGTALVDELPPEPAAESKESSPGLGVTATEVWRGFHEMEAHLARSMLESHGIDAEVWSAGVGPNVPFGSHIAHRVMVTAADSQEARRLIASLQ